MHGNLSVCARYGEPSHIRLFYCNACKARFSERKGTAPFQAHNPKEKAIAVFQHRDEGCGIRVTGRLVGVDPNTVGRLARIAGQHARDAHDELVAFPPSSSRCRVRREVAFVSKKQKNSNQLDPADDPKGGWWDHVAFGPKHTLVLAVVPGARRMSKMSSLRSRTALVIGCPR
ncbi:hypothetical protein SAMN05444166_5042 [Singulisphaera sp. GP187]|uniref:hypothetical protein n=1 Tax=Singulisphaera sp. GP187 TaxID=1882752 RepID=UPI0009283978|nr:hypothetical protein [Singulisphaera sp. GP187]SIO47299.1 hypothetical protein SAMN05444166_5042 [Singulisphaera sp. GP187]